MTTSDAVRPATWLQRLESGAEADPAKTIPLEDVLEVCEDVREKLNAAGFEEAPAFHFQMEAEY